MSAQGQSNPMAGNSLYMGNQSQYGPGAFPSPGGYGGAPWQAPQNSGQSMQSMWPGVNFGGGYGGPQQQGGFMQQQQQWQPQQWQQPMSFAQLFGGNYGGNYGQQQGGFMQQQQQPQPQKTGPGAMNGGNMYQGGQMRVADPAPGYGGPAVGPGVIQPPAPQDPYGNYKGPHMMTNYGSMLGGMR